MNDRGCIPKLIKDDESNDLLRKGRRLKLRSVPRSKPAVIAVTAMERLMELSDPSHMLRLFATTFDHEDANDEGGSVVGAVCLHACLSMHLNDPARPPFERRGPRAFGG